MYHVFLSLVLRYFCSLVSLILQPAACLLAAPPWSYLIFTALKILRQTRHERGLCVFVCVCNMCSTKWLVNVGSPFHHNLLYFYSLHMKTASSSSCTSDETSVRHRRLFFLEHFEHFEKYACTLESESVQWTQSGCVLWCCHALMRETMAEEGADEERRPLIVWAAADVPHNPSHLTPVFLTLLWEKTCYSVSSNRSAVAPLWQWLLQVVFVSLMSCETMWDIWCH